MVSRRPKFMSALLKTAYVPTELPPAITTKYVSEFCEKDYAFLRTNRKQLIKTTTNYDTFTAPRTSGGRRNLAIVHPISQMGLSLLITEHRSRLRRIIDSNGISYYETKEDMHNNRAFSGLNFKKWRLEKAKLCSESKFILQADISRYFYTAYTHSFPWSVIGKEKVKNWIVHNKSKLNKHWSNDFDVVLQSCQSRETFGIPVGPDTSRIIAEILVSGVEADKELGKILISRPAIRLVDDYLVGFDSEEEAHKALGVLRSALWRFNLQLNDAKTKVLPSSLIFEDRWKLDFEAIGISSNDPKQQGKDIARLRDLTLGFCAETGTSAPAHWASNRLNSLINIRENFDLILEVLLRFARDFPSVIPYLSVFVINNKYTCRSSYRKRLLTDWVRRTIQSELHKGHDLEVAWCLVIAGVLKIEITEDQIDSFDDMPSSVVFSLFGMLRERKLLKFSLSKWRWRSHYNQSGVLSENWLPIYEAVRRGWTEDKRLVAAVQSNDILNRMLKSDVTFLEDRVFDASTINLRSRTFRRDRRTAVPQDETQGITRARGGQVSNDELVLDVEQFVSSYGV